MSAPVVARTAPTPPSARPRRPALGPAGSALVALVALALIVAGCAAREPSASGGASGAPGAPRTLTVVATTTVLADLVAQVGGPRVSVASLVPKGGEVHTYDPRPSDLVKVDDADLIFVNGLGLDDWLARVAADVGTRAPTIRLGENLPGATYIGDVAGRPNPHLWLNVAYAEGYVARIESALAAADPADAAGFAERATAYRARLADLDAWVRSRIAMIHAQDRAFVSFHDALPYFAAAYGLRVVGVVVPAPGQDPSAGEVAALVSAVRAAGVHAVFAEAQFNPALAQALATEAGARVVADLYDDTLGDPPVDTYEGLIRWDVDRFVEALR